MKKLIVLGLIICFSTLQISYASAQGTSSLKKVSRKHPFITLDTTFLFEASINSYTFSDQIMEHKGLLLCKPVNLSSYKSFYCTFHPNKTHSIETKRLKKVSSNIHGSDKSVLRLNLDLELSDSPLIDSNINLQPYCGTRYVPRRLKLDLVYLGKVPHRVPLFLNCGEYELYKSKHNGKNYTIERIHTYLITKVY